MAKKYTSIREAREKKNLTQKQIAEKAGISESYYNLIENGKRRTPVTLAAKIAQILEITLDEFFLLYNTTLSEECAIV